MRNKIFQRTIVIVKYFSVLFSLINGDVSQVHRQINLHTMYTYHDCNFHRVTYYHISNAILIIRKFFFFLKVDLTPVKCKSFLFSECKYDTGFVLLYIEVFRNWHSFSYIGTRLPLNTLGIKWHHELKRLYFLTTGWRYHIEWAMSVIIRIKEFSSGLQCPVVIKFASITAVGWN